MLTQTLRDLQRDGYIEREVFPTKPPSVEYRMTPLGRSLFEPLFKVLEWAAANHDSIKAARERSEEHTSELQSLMRTSTAVFCLIKKITQPTRIRGLTYVNTSPKHKRVQ